MQTEAQRWDIDDILLTTTVSPEDQRHLAISCKSNRQVTRSGLPADFVARCWQQWAKPEPNPIQKGKGCLMLVTRDWNRTFPETWSELKKDAPGSDLALALGRMRQTDKRRKVFDSVKDPARDAGVTVDDAEVIAMIDTIEVELVDFHTANSWDEKLAIRLARTLLVNNSHAEGKRLWTELVAQAEKTRLGPGTLDISELWRRLRTKFNLKDHPDYEASWLKLRALTRDIRETIETALPSGLAVDRTEETNDLVDRIA